MTNKGKAPQHLLGQLQGQDQATVALTASRVLTVLTDAALICCQQELNPRIPVPRTFSAFALHGI